MHWVLILKWFCIYLTYLNNGYCPVDFKVSFGCLSRFSFDKTKKNKIASDREQKVKLNRIEY